jgi:Protein of unknown function (DUF1501)
MRHATVLPTITRREALRRMGSGFGMVGLAGLLGNSLLQGATVESVADPLAPRPTHFPAKAKHVIFLFLNGGLSQVDTFDPKPMLDKYHGQAFPGGNPMTERKTGNLLRSPFKFKKYGQSGIEVSEIFPHLGQCVDDICVIRSMHTNVPIHESSLFMMNCGDIQPGRPSMGSWVTYGLGTENQNLPGFVVLCPGVPVVGPPLWNSTFLPAVYQGTHIPNNESDPQKLIQYIHNAQLNLTQQREQLDLLEKLNRLHLEQRKGDAQLEAGIQAMEIAYRMQTEAPEVFDIRKEDDATRQRYGEGDFARGCLMALRLVERGVRMVQVYFGNAQPWDNHEDILVHQKLAQQADKPIAALLKDLKSRGLLGETVVICGSEFGRTPVVENSAAVKVQNGRDHNPYGFSMWLAGGGIKGGMTYGATDDFGFKAVENPVHVHDLHATILHLLGLDHTKLTYRYSGRDFRLTDVEGNVIKAILA